MSKWQKNRLLENIYHDYFDSIYKYVYFRVRNIANAEEVTSSIFEKIINNIESYKKQEGATLKSWVYAITRNALIDFYRANKNITEELNENIKDKKQDRISADDKIDQSLALEKVFSLIDRLPERQREMITLRYQLDLSNKEIARMLEIDQKTVSGALSKAISILKNELKGE